MSELPAISIRVSGAVEPSRCVELAKAAEDAGLATVWFAENPAQRGILATAGACAASTRHVRIGVGVVNPYTRHPVQIAMDFAALDELSGGRAILGIGSGIAAALRGMGFDTNRPVGAVREAIEIVRAMLSGQSVTLRGHVFTINDTRLHFPARLLPIYMAAGGERALRVCGAIADGFIVSNMTPLRLARRMREIVADAAAEAGRPKPRVVQYLPCAVAADGEMARQAVKAAVGEALTLLWPVSDSWPRRREAAVTESGIPRDNFVAALDRLRRGDDPADVLDERFVGAFAIAGTAQECSRQAAYYREAGVDELALTFADGQSIESIASLAKVLP
jgi:5,10-methylenetetrahydromethanopterin reductase